MGNIFSNIESSFGDALSSATPLGRLPDQAMIYNKTQTTSILMKRIIDFILQNSDIKDTISLATDKGCGEWLILAKSHINDMLTEIDVEPSMGSDGILYLSKINKFIKKEGSSVKSDDAKISLKNQYCTLIAFFSIRLFQVVGALALSVLDSEIPLTNYDPTTGKISGPRGFKQTRSVNGIFGYQRPSATRKVKGLLGDVTGQVKGLVGDVSSRISQVFQSGGGLNMDIFKGFYLEEIINDKGKYYLRNLSRPDSISRSQSFVLEQKYLSGNPIDEYRVSCKENEPFEFTIKFDSNKILLTDFMYSNSNKNLVYVGKTQITPGLLGNPEIIDTGISYSTKYNNHRNIANSVYNNSTEPKLETIMLEIIKAAIDTSSSQKLLVTNALSALPQPPSNSNIITALEPLAQGITTDFKYDYKIKDYRQYNEYAKINLQRLTSVAKPPRFTVTIKGARNDQIIDFGEYIDKYVVNEIKTQAKEYLLVVLKKYNYISVNSNQFYNIKDPNETNSKSYVFISARNYSDGTPVFFYEIEKIVANKKYAIRIDFKLEYIPKKSKDIVDAENELANKKIANSAAAAALVSAKSAEALNPTDQQLINAAAAATQEATKAKDAVTAANKSLIDAKKKYASSPQSKEFELYFVGPLTLTIKDLTENGRIIKRDSIADNDLIEIDKSTHKIIFNFAPDDTSDGEPRITDGRYSSTSTIPLLLEKKLSDLVKELVDDDGIENTYIDSKNGFNPPLSDKDIGKRDNALIYTELWKSLSQKGTPIKSFCVARALQLLNGEGLQRKLPDSIVPMVFNAKFPFIDNKSLPALDQSITTAAPIKALDTLFKKPNIIKPDGKPVDFGSSYDSRRDNSLKKILESFDSRGEASLAQIKELSKPAASKDIYYKREDYDVIQDLRSKAISLFQTQFDHTRKVNILLKKIFTFDKGISVNPTLLAKGVRGIEDIAAEARDLLVDYYSKCQTAYADGIFILQTPSYKRGMTRKKGAPP